MTSDLCGDVVARLSSPQIISSETVSPADVGSGSASGGGTPCVGSTGRTSSASMELGRRLLLAARAGDTPTVLDLMAKGAPFTADWLGTSPLHLAAVNAHADTCAVLLRSGVSRDLRTKVERTPLHMAAYAGHADVVKLLLEHDAQVDCRDMLRMTPLHWAVERGHAAVAAVLLRHGADPALPSKFYKTPHSLAVELRRADMLKLIEDALKDREAALSVDALVNEHMTDTSDPNIENLESIVQKIRETKPLSKAKEQPENVSKKSKTPEMGVGGEGGEEGAAAQLLRKHGITLLPTDDGSTVLNAIQSGRTVVLSDAGKLMLKESESEPLVKKAPPTPATGQKGVVLTATPVKTQPKPGVKIFTLNNKLIALPKDNNRVPIKKIINPQLKQVKFVQLSPDAKIITTNKTTIPMKAKNKVIQPMVAVGGGRAPAPLQVQRPAVKIIMNKSNFNKLLANADNSIVENIQTEINQQLASPAAETKTLEEDVEDILRVREDFLLKCSAKYLRTHALAARRALAALKAQLDQYKASLAQYQHAHQ